jgi:hypothetical protein
VAFTTADQFALSGQARTLHGTAARLIVTLLAALCLAFAPLWMTSVAWQDARHGIEVFGLIAAALFLAALLYELWLIKTRPERDWYDGRAVAESVKTLSWRYAVGGHPYPRGGGTESAFMHDLRSLGIDIAPLRQALESGGRPTPWMTRLRASSLADRQNAYIVQRVRDQEAWYARKARYNVTQARRWSRALLTFEALAVGFALVKALGLVELDLASFAAAAIAGGAAWLALKQHESVAAARLRAQTTQSYR